MKSSEHSTSGRGEDSPMNIGTLAERFGLATHVLRHWEAMGLLTPARDGAGRRRYRAADLTRVAVILRAKEAGLSLDTIRSLAATTVPAKRRDILRDEAEALRSRVAAAQASLELIECALGCDHEDFTQCPHFQQMMADRVGADAPDHIPVRAADRGQSDDSVATRRARAATIRSNHTPPSRSMIGVGPGVTGRHWWSAAVVVVAVLRCCTATSQPACRADGQPQLPTAVVG